MGLAAALFFVAGLLDGAYPGGEGWIDRGSFAYLSHAFGVMNLIVAVAIARGSETGLLLRILLAGLFFVERPLSAFVFGPKAPESIAVHLVTALVELIILLNALRVWRLGRSVDSEDLDALFSLETPLTPSAQPASWLAAPKPRPQTWPLAGRLTLIIAALSLTLSAALAADAALAGFIPGGIAWGWGGAASGWFAYLFALVLLVIAARAIQGSSLPLRLLLLLSLLIFVERPLSPLVFGHLGLATIALHVLAAFLALGVALASVAGLRSLEATRQTEQVDGAAS